MKAINLHKLAVKTLKFDGATEHRNTYLKSHTVAKEYPEVQCSTCISFKDE